MRSRRAGLGQRRPLVRCFSGLGGGRLLGERLERRELLATDVIISELMAANSAGLEDADGDTSDWIELHNTSASAVNLSGWALSDDVASPRRWTFPDVSLPAGAYLVVFASSKDRRDGDGELHTNFSLSREGEYLALVRVDGALADRFQPSYPHQFTDVSYGVGTIKGAATHGYMDLPTPGESNGPVYRGLTGRVQLSHRGGVYDEPLQVVIQSEPESVVRYTTDGSLPTAANGNQYAGPLTIDRTTTLRAAAFTTDYLPSAVATSTYLILGDVLTQTQPAHFPPLTVGDYDVDPDIALSGQYRDRLEAGLRDLPSVSIVLPVEAFLGPRGVYSHPQQRGEGWERAVSVEWFPAAGDGSDGFQIDAGLRIQGGASRNPETSPKHSLSIRFRERYGAASLEYPLFPNSPVTRFDSLSLRAGSNNTWISGNAIDRSRAQYQRDQWVRDSMLEMGHADAGRGEYVHLYINGLYWGLYNLTERPTAAHYAEYFGGDDDDYDAFNGSQVIDGTRDSLQRMRNVVAGGDWNSIQTVLDVDQYIDYNILNRYGSNSDLDASRNYRLAGGGPADAPWRVYPWDSEEVLYGEGSTGEPTDPVGIRNDMEKLLEYRVRFGDRLHQHLFNGGALTRERAAERWMRRAGQIDRAIIGESARWGDHRREDQPYGRDREWIAEQTRLLKAYFPARGDVLLNLYRQDGLYPTVDAPAFSQHGGLAPRNFSLELAAPQGTIQYTTDGSDPRLPGGAVNPAAQTYGGAITLVADTHISARVLHEGEWSALTRAAFLLQSDLPLVVSEIQAAPHAANLVEGVDEMPVDKGEFEFIELTNVGTEAIELRGVRLLEQEIDGARGGVSFEFSAQSLEPGEQIVVPRNREAFRSRYGSSIRLAEGGPAAGMRAGQYSGDLDDRGETITLWDANGDVVQLFSYASAIAKNPRARGDGSSLELLEVASADDGATSWRAGASFGGSPGRPGSDLSHDVMVSEMLVGDPPRDNGWIEFHNTTGGVVDVQQWYFGGPGNPIQTRIAPALTLMPGARVVVEQSKLEVPIDRLRGGEVWLVRTDERGVPIEFVDHFGYPIHWEGLAVGRPSDDASVIVPLDFATPGAVNTTALVEDLVISEIQFHPPDYDGAGVGIPADTFEYIEIFNRSDQEIDLENWRLVGDIDLTFDRGTRIAAGGTLLAVGFLPTRGTQANPFREAYGIDRSTVMAGPYLGRMPNGHGTVRLERPLVPPDPFGPPVPYLLVDQLEYGTETPWPDTSAGQGETLERISGALFGNRATNWQASWPNPGTAPLRTRLAGDANEDSRFDSSDLVQIMQLGKFSSAVAATFAEGDWNRDGRFDMDDLLKALAMNQYESAAIADEDLLPE